MPGERYVVAPLLIIAAAVRIAINNVAEYSPADETVYLVYTKALVAGEGYAKVVRMFVADRGMWVFPNPLRWAWLGATSLFCSATGEVTHRALATLSTIAGIVAVALTYWIARELFGGTTAVIATALVATSPLQLALGRRALADEFFCAAVLASIAALLRCTPVFRWPRALVWVAATTIAIATKEQFLFIYPVVILFWWLRSRTLGWRELVVWALPPFLFAAVYCALAGEVTSFFQVVRIITGSIEAPFAGQYQSGPPQRLILDLMSIAPIVTIVALGALVAIVMRRAAYPRELRHLALLAAGILAVHAIVPSQNVRYIVAADALLRIVAAAYVVTEQGGRKWVIIAAIAVNAAVELKLFYDIFIAGDVYDPVTDNVLRALRMLPR